MRFTLSTSTTTAYHNLSKPLEWVIKGTLRRFQTKIKIKVRFILSAVDSLPPLVIVAFCPLVSYFDSSNREGPLPV